MELVRVQAESERRTAQREPIVNPWAVTQQPEKERARRDSVDWTSSRLRVRGRCPRRWSSITRSTIPAVRNRLAHAARGPRPSGQGPRRGAPPRDLPSAEPRPVTSGFVARAARLCPWFATRRRV